MAQRPTVNDLLAYLDIASDAVPGDGSPLDESLQAALDFTERRLRDGVIPDDVDSYPSRVRMYVLMSAAKLYKRRLSPEGVAGFGDLGVVRILGDDPQAEQLISDLVRLDGFA